MSRLVDFLTCMPLAVAMMGIAGCEPGATQSGPAAAGGGSASSRAVDPKNDLWQFGVAYLDYHDVHGEGPPDWDTLLAFAAERNHKSDAIQRVRDAGYQVKWGVKIREVAATGTSILEYVIAESPQGGPKLMLDGSIGQ
jgi:hypothetical protein